MNQCDGCQAGMSLSGGFHFDGRSKFVCTAKLYEKRPYAQPEAGRKNVYMDRDTLKRLKDIGGGNVSAGIRIAAKAYNG